jgi:hypothetical protein
MFEAPSSTWSKEEKESYVGCTTCLHADRGVGVGRSMIGMLWKTSNKFKIHRGLMPNELVSL